MTKKILDAEYILFYAKTVLVSTKTILDLAKTILVLAKTILTNSQLKKPPPKGRRVSLRPRNLAGLETVFP